MRHDDAMSLLPRPWRRFTDAEMTGLALATVRWFTLPATGLLLALLVATLFWMVFAWVAWPFPATVAALVGLHAVERAAATAARRSRDAALAVVVAHCAVAVVAAAATAATFTFAGLPLLLALVPTGWAFLARPGDDRLARGAALTTAVGAVGAVVALSAYLGAHLWFMDNTALEVRRAVLVLTTLAIVLALAHVVVRLAPWLAVVVLVVNVLLGVGVTAVALAVQNVSLGDPWALYPLLGAAMALSSLAAAPLGWLRLAVPAQDPTEARP